MTDKTENVAHIHAWLRANGIDPEFVYEVRIIAGATIRIEALSFALDAEGKRFLIPGTKDPARRSQTVPLSCFPSDDPRITTSAAEQSA